jgi:hypothetical protein
MKMKIEIKSLVVGALLGAVVVFSIGAASYRPKWDYKLISGHLSQNPPLTQQLEQAAAEGWDVVTATSDNGYPIFVMRKPK